MAATAVELLPYEQEGESIHEQVGRTGRTGETDAADASRALPPVDGGWQAWSFLAACFVLEGVVWGLPFSFGVFQTYYSSHELFASQGTSVAAIGTTATGVAYFLCPFFCILLQRWPQFRRHSMVLGLALMTISLVAASFCSTVGGLIATQGVLYALGSILLYFPATLFLDEWFVARKGLAFGIMWAGTGTAGVGLPFLLNWMLDAYGFRTTLRVWTLVVVLSTIPCLLVVKPRLPVSAASAFRPQDLSFIKHLPFWLFQFGNVTYSLGVFLPSLWMPSFAAAIGLPVYAGPLSVAFYNAGFSVGAIALGYITDRFNITVSIVISTVGASISAFIFWGLASSQVMLYLFAITWGIFAGGFNGTWTGCAAAMRRLERNGNVDTGIVIGLMAAGKGIGGVVSGPLSEKLLGVGWKAHSRFAHETSYGPLVIFCGVSAAFGGTAAVGRLLRLI